MTSMNPLDSSFIVRIVPPRSVETATSTECMTAKLTTQDALSAHLREGPDFIVSLAQEAIRRAVQPTKACVER
ncbi:MAG: hypothetical protein J07HQW1_01528 [Haloquadratum walsbyi J07HQW1]|uniref:Uncharacterized protein n=1 Tax=Haloquadratum walsbyi J07HQW1 TaxID=1238424 RepID=U1MNQ6_9EURY|nr:MAG: hypothetical protein J07HQW1_01528 [Haloquadratum walsbyi J07HQW1]